MIVPRPRALPGAVAVFRALRSAGIPHAVATAISRPLIDASLDAVGIGPEAVVVEGKGELRIKPEPDIFLASRERLKVQVADCVVGDTIWDHVAARQAGMPISTVRSRRTGAARTLESWAFGLLSGGRRRLNARGGRPRDLSLKNQKGSQ